MLTKLNRLSPGRPRRTRKPFRRTGRRTRLDTAVLTNTPVSPTELILKVMTDRCSSLSPLTYWRTNGEEQEPSYYRARYYDPTAGRFISEDPITFTGGINFYRYVRNNPVNLVDPFGLNPAPSIPWPLPWFPPGSGVLGGLGNLVGGAVDVLGKAAIPITVIYKLTIGAKPMGIDDARAIPKPKPCDKDRDNHCEQIYEEDKAICLALPRKEQKAVCMRQAATRYGECLAKGEPSSPLSWW